MYYNANVCVLALTDRGCAYKSYHAMSRTGPLCPPTRGTSGDSLPTLACGRMRKAPPPPDSTITATNFGLTAQNVESHDDLETLKKKDRIKIIYCVVEHSWLSR